MTQWTLFLILLNHKILHFRIAQITINFLRFRFCYFAHAFNINYGYNQSKVEASLHYTLKQQAIMSVIQHFLENLFCIIKVILFKFKLDIGSFESA